MKPVYHNQLPAMKGYLPNEKSESPDIDCDDPDCECQQQDPVDYYKVIIRNELLAELRTKVQEMKEGK